MSAHFLGHRYKILLLSDHNQEPKILYSIFQVIFYVELLRLELAFFMNMKVRSKRTVGFIIHSCQGEHVLRDKLI